MQNRQNIFIALGLLLLGLLIALIYIQVRNNRLKDWRETYDPESDTPYASGVLLELLGKDYKIKQVRGRIADELIQTSDENTLYLYIAPNYRPTNTDIDSLLAFVDQGNDALIISQQGYQVLDDTLGLPLLNNNQYPKNFLELFDTVPAHIEVNNRGAWSDSLIEMSFETKELQRSEGFMFHYSSDGDSATNLWSHLYPAAYYADTTNAEVLGNIRFNAPPKHDLEEVDRTLPNFICVPYGKGKIYLHQEPIIFTNYFILHPEGYDYAGRVFSYFPNAKTIYYDLASRKGGNGKTNDFSYSNTNPKESPLRFILSQTELRWAYFILLSLVILFVIFKGKRRQRVIPILPKNHNTSLEFVDTVGRLYFQQGSHLQVAKLKKTIFLSFLRTHYYLTPPDDGLLDEDFQKQLVLKSQFDTEHVEGILSELTQMDAIKEASSQYLENLHQKLDYFYKNCK